MNKPNHSSDPPPASPSLARIIKTLGSNMVGIRAVLIATLSVFVAACAIYTHRGLYEISDAAGWHKMAPGSATLFSPATMKQADGYVGFRSEGKGAIVLMSYFPRHVVEFQGDSLRIIPHDGGVPITHILSHPRIDVSSTSDFTLELPRVKIDSQLMPAIVVRCRWSDRIYLDYVGIGE